MGFFKNMIKLCTEQYVYKKVSNDYTINTAQEIISKFNNVTEMRIFTNGDTRDEIIEFTDNLVRLMNETDYVKKQESTPGR